MRHNPKIIILILAMFLITQIIGLYVIDYYSPVRVVNNIQQNITSPNQLPFGEPPPETSQAGIAGVLSWIIPSFVIAILVFLLLAKIKAAFFLKAWFFLVVLVALSTSFFSFMNSKSVLFLIISVVIAAPLAFIKIYKRNILVHNLTELLIYPGIASIFVAILSSPLNPNRGVYAMIILLILISLYDLWAVWHSGIMQKMAKYQINKLKIFAGFFIPYMSKALREKLRKMRRMGKKDKKIKVNVAILGGGDIVFPLITAGVVLRKFGFTEVLGLQLPLASMIVIFGAMLGLSYLLLFAHKKRFYPAMPFISAGIFLALGLCYLIF